MPTWCEDTLWQRRMLLCAINWLYAQTAPMVGLIPLFCLITGGLNGILVAIPHTLIMLIQALLFRWWRQSLIEFYHIGLMQKHGISIPEELLDTWIIHPDTKEDIENRKKRKANKRRR